MEQSLLSADGAWWLTKQSYWQSFFRPRPLKFLLGGIFLGIFDASFHLLGVEIVLNGYSANLIVGIFFSISFGLFAWTIGVLIENREILDYQEKLKEKEALATIGRRLWSCPWGEKSSHCYKMSASLLQEEWISHKESSQFYSTGIQPAQRFYQLSPTILPPIQLQLTEVDTAPALIKPGPLHHENCSS